CRGPIGAYPNIENRSKPRADGTFAASASPADFAVTMRRWHDELGATLLGGCCGATAAHIAALDTLADHGYSSPGPPPPPVAVGARGVPLRTDLGRHPPLALRPVRGEDLRRR